MSGTMKWTRTGIHLNEPYDEDLHNSDGIVGTGRMP